MPYLDDSEKFPKFEKSKDAAAHSLFFRLKNVGDKARIRILGKPFVEGKHFVEEGGRWTVSSCGLINNNEPCVRCEQYRFAMAERKRGTKEEDVQKKYPLASKASIIVYYPALHRDACRFVIFQTTMSVRNAIVSQAALGTNIYQCDFIILRSAKIGPNSYMVTKADSQDTPPLSEEEIEEIKKSKTVKIHEVIPSSNKDESIDTVVIRV